MAYSNKIMCTNVRLSTGALQSKRDNNENSGQSIAAFARLELSKARIMSGLFSFLSVVTKLAQPYQQIEIRNHIFRHFGIPPANLSRGHSHSPRQLGPMNPGFFQHGI